MSHPWIEASQTSAYASPDLQDDESGDRPGAVLMGRYQLIAQLGRGGAGVVWHCHDLELDDEVALKLLREDLAGPEGMAAWLRREARLARRVTHPNVARTFEFGHRDGRYFLTMEYILGESLRTWIDHAGALPQVWVRALAVSMCRGLTAALAAGALHGAIRPGNVLLSPERGVVLTDLGIARATPGPQAVAPAVRPYLAPERWHGGAITPRSDVFAIGAVLFEALAGRPPATSEVLALAAPRSSADRLRLPGLPVAWAELLADCLHPDPERRLADVRSVLVRLGTAPDGP